MLLSRGILGSLPKIFLGFQSVFKDCYSRILFSQGSSIIISDPSKDSHCLNIPFKGYAGSEGTRKIEDARSRIGDRNVFYSQNDGVF